MAGLTPTQQPHSFFGHGRKPKGPGAISRGINYGKAVHRYRKNHGYILPLEMANSRSDTCHSNQCGMYDAKLDRCQHLTCGCKIKDKATWSTEQCPKGHWLPVFGPAPNPKPTNPNPTTSTPKA